MVMMPLQVVEGDDECEGNYYWSSWTDEGIDFHDTRLWNVGQVILLWRAPGILFSAIRHYDAQKEILYAIDESKPLENNNGR